METIRPAPPTADNGATPPAPSFDTLFAVPAEHLEVEERDGAHDVPEVGSPGKQTYFRVHPELTHVVRLLKLEETGRFLLCAHGIDHPDIANFRLHLVRTRHGKLKLWPIRLPRHGDDFAASKQARAVVADAITAWCSMRWVGGKGGHYTWKKYPDVTDVPTWPTADFDTLVLRAFDGATITDPADPLIAALPRLDDTP